MPKLENINFSYPEQDLFRDLSIDFPKGSITCILGPSGCGKSTLLNIISGLLKPSSGSIIGFDDSSHSFIFQETRILPWKTVYQNISFPLHDKMSQEKVKNQTEKFMGLVELNEWKDNFPSSLSGGMKQRIAIARAFAFLSSTILMDEAFQGLDIGLKTKLFEVFLRSWNEDPRTVVYVTHDISEALYLGNQIYIMSKSPNSELSKFELDGKPGPGRQIDKKTEEEINNLFL